MLWWRQGFGVDRPHHEPGAATVKFLISSPAYVLGQYIAASPQAPVTKSFPNDTDTDHISRNWKPLDKAAVAALAKLGVKSEVIDEEEAMEAVPTGEPGKVPKGGTPETMAAAQATAVKP